jgi:hypothetical protein
LGAGRDPQRHRRVPKVVDAQPVQADDLHRRPPEAAAVQRPAQRAAVRPGEHVVLGLAWRRQQPGERVDDEPGQPDRAAAGARRGRADVQHAPRLGDHPRPPAPSRP